ncbi:hypothetical protein QBC44DRAFT_362920 [Cladorrhinum sp. PSN332]|nr:hypothetical protein QBC44DRAFT_362920 [Cladorrhinum sp. PSN332]
MSELYSNTGFAVGASLVGITLIPVAVTWVVSLKKVVIAPNSKQIKIARLLAQCALPVFGLGIILNIPVRALRASGAIENDASVYRTQLYLWLTTVFLFYAAALLTSMAAYIATYGVLYLALGRWKWWSLIQLDASIGGGVISILIIALYAKNMSSLSGESTSSLTRYGFDFSLHWLALIVDGTLTIVALGVGGVAIYAASKLNKPDRAHLNIGKIPVAMLVASFLWLVRCVYSVAVGIKNMQDDWSTAEYGAQNIVFPLFELWTMAAVLALVVYVVRRPIWSDPSAIPNEPRPHQLPAVAAPPVVQYVYVQQLAPGQQPPPQPYIVGQQPPQMYQQPPVYQQGQPPVVYQTQPFQTQPFPQQPVPQQTVPVQQQQQQQQPIPVQQQPAQQATQ